MTGAERPRVMSATDQRLKQRVYAYVNQGTGIRPESGVGRHAHRVPMDNLYDLSADPLGFRSTFAGDPNAIESAVLDAGFSGVLVRDRLDGMAVAVMLGPDSHAVAAEPMEDPDAAPPVAEQERTDADRLYDEVKEAPWAPTGQMRGSRWLENLERNDPDMMNRLDALGVLEQLQDSQFYYPDQVASMAREAARNTEGSFSRDPAGDDTPSVSFDVSYDVTTPAGQDGGTGGVVTQGEAPTPPPAGKENFSHWAYLGKNSDGQAILIGTAHPSVSDRSALQSWWRRWWTKEGNLTEEAFARRVEADGIKNAQEVYTAFMSSGFMKAARKAYKKTFFTQISPEAQRRMNDYLAGDTEVTGVPKSVRDELDAMRGHLDQLSTKLQGVLIDEMRFAAEALDPASQQILLDNIQAAFDGDQEAMEAIENLPRLANYIAGKIKTLQTIEGNKGSYLHRSYRIFDDPKWRPSDEVMNRARAFLREQVDADSELAQATDQQKDNRVDGIINSILGTNASSMVGFLGGQLGQKDRSFLKRRKDIAPEIRALMGEYTDPRTNFSTSVTKMAYMVANHHFLKKVREDGLGLFLSKKPQGNMGTEISSWDSESMAPLAGLYATQDFAQALKDQVEPKNIEGWVKNWYMINTAVKYGKTVGSPTTAMRNLWSAGFFTVMNGHFDYSHALEAARVTIADLATRDKSKMEYIRHLAQLGVLHDNPRARELMAAMEDVADMDQTKGNIGTRGAKVVLNFATRFYRAGDDFWKIIGFENEKKQLMGYGMGREEAEAMAADRVRNGYPTYSMVPETIKMVRLFPLVGTFVSFPWEMIRTTSHQFRFVKEDLAAGRTSMAMKRGAGMLTATALGYVAKEISQAMLGIDDEEDQAIRELAAPWQKNMTPVYLPPDEQGNVRYLDLTHLDPYSYLKLPVNAILNGNNRGADEKMIDALSEFLIPFMGTDLTTQAIGEVWFNSRMDSGAPVYDVHASRVEQGKQVGEHLLKNLAPGVVNNVRRTWLAANDRVASYGKPYSMTDEMLAWVGLRLTTADTQTSLKFRAFDFDDHKSAAGRPTYRALRDFNPVSEGKMRQAVRHSYNIWTEAFDEMHQAVTAARASEMSEDQIGSTLDGAGVAGKYIPQLLRGRTPMWRPSRQSIRNAYESVTQGRVSISTEDFERRVEIMEDELEQIRREREENQ